MKDIGRIVFLFIGYIGVLIASFWATLFLGFYQAVTPEIIQNHVAPFSILYILWLILIFLFNLYEPKLSRPTLANLKNTGQMLVVCFFVGVIFFYGFSNFVITPKSNLVINILTFGLLFLAWRRFFFLIFAKNFHKNVCIIAEENNPYAEELREHIEKNPHIGYKIVQSISNSELFFNNTADIDTVIISSEMLRSPKLFKKIYTSNVSIVELSHAYEDLLVKIPVGLIDESWFIYKIGTQKYTFNQSIKRLIDIIFSFVGIVFFSPLLLISAIAIKIEDEGPIFIKQTRCGKSNKIFKIFKLRSMIVLSRDGSAETPGNAKWASEKDPRITKVGAILRKTHIDEIPQLFNILKGDISLVGPRPERPEFVTELEQAIPFYHLRHIVKPGFTGWAQIKFRYARSIDDSREKFEYDLYYIKNKNLLLDIGVIFKTVQIIFSHK